MTTFSPFRLFLVLVLGVSIFSGPAMAEVPATGAAPDEANPEGVCGARPLPIAVGATISENLSLTDCLADRVRPGGYHRDLYVFAAVAGRTYTIDMVAQVFDTYLWLSRAGSGSVTLVQDNDSGLGTNARIVYRALRSETLYIGATSSRPFDGGVYLLSLRDNGGGVKPAAPTSLSGTAIRGGPVVLSWRDNANNEQGYDIERRTGRGPWIIVGRIGPDSKQFTDRGAARNTTYGYRVRAFNSAGFSAYTPFIVVTTQR